MDSGRQSYKTAEGKMWTADGKMCTSDGKMWTADGKMWTADGKIKDSGRELKGQRTRTCKTTDWKMCIRQRTGKYTAKRNILDSGRIM